MTERGAKDSVSTLRDLPQGIEPGRDLWPQIEAQIGGRGGAVRGRADLLRRRLYLVRKRAALLTHVRIVNSQYNLPPLPKNLSAVANRATIAERFRDPSVHKNVAVDLALADHLDGVISDLEKSLVRTAKVDDAEKSDTQG